VPQDLTPVADALTRLPPRTRGEFFDALFEYPELLPHMAANILAKRELGKRPTNENAEMVIESERASVREILGEEI